MTMKFKQIGKKLKIGGNGEVDELEVLAMYCCSRSWKERK